MVIGIDLDNTVVRYDALFHRVAVRQGLIPSRVQPTKEAVRDFLRASGREEDWVRLQGHVYGPGLADADPHAGALEFLIHCRERGATPWIISHKTRQPAQGPAHDLHGAARAWLDRRGFLRTEATGLSPDHVCFEPTAAAKRQRIAAAGCRYFVDDLPEFLEDPAFPAATERILFDPGNRHATTHGLRRAVSWPEIEAIVLC